MFYVVWAGGEGAGPGVPVGVVNGGGLPAGEGRGVADGSVVAGAVVGGGVVLRLSRVVADGGGNRGLVLNQNIVIYNDKTL